MLIRDAALEGGKRADVRLAGGRVQTIGALVPSPGEPVCDAGGGLLLPGLHDHHIHVAAFAAALQSVACGPPDVCDVASLASTLAAPGAGWLRGIGYHESVAGLLDRTTLDRMQRDRPVRIQHRGGRMWFLNSAALDLLRDAGPTPAGLDRANGRLFDGDAWLRAALGGTPPDFAAVGRHLARHGVTGVTEISPSNDAVIAQHFARERDAGALPQRVLLAGRIDLSAVALGNGIRLGPVKLHLHEAALPDLDATVAAIRTAHDRARAVAVHCATEVELVFALAALTEAGMIYGDRIEHGSVAPDSAVAEIARLGLAVVSQPHFVAERGDAYRADVAAADQPLLYRLRTFLDAGVTLAAGSDAPFGAADPWASMAAAVSRRTASGAVIGGGEALDAAAALDLYLRDPERLDRRRAVTVGAPADLCLLDRGWDAARAALDDVGVSATWIDGVRVFDRVDQPPVERGLRADPLPR